MVRELIFLKQLVLIWISLGLGPGEDRITAA